MPKYNLRQLLYHLCSPSKSKCNIVDGKFTLYEYLHSWRTRIIPKSPQTITLDEQSYFYLLFLSKQTEMGLTMHSVTIVVKTETNEK